MVFPRSGGNGTKKWVAVGIIALLEISAMFYLYISPATGESQNPFVIPTSTTTTTTTSVSLTTIRKPVDHLTVNGTGIVNDTVMLAVHNIGPSPTKAMAITKVCTPGFVQCFDYKRMAGAYYNTTFVLPAGGNFRANLTRVCVIAIYRCAKFLPVANQTYYLQLKFNFADGASVTDSVSVMNNNETWSPTTFSKNATFYSAVQTPGPTQLLLLHFNQSTPYNGLVNSTVYLNSTATNATFSLQLYGYRPGALGGFTRVLLTNKTTCTSCSSPIPVAIPFYSVLTAVSAGSTYAVVVHSYEGGNQTSTWFAYWVQAQNGK